MYALYDQQHTQGLKLLTAFVCEKLLQQRDAEGSVVRGEMKIWKGNILL